MIAEIYGKISKTGSNLTERLEDQLTGNFFGSLRYLPFDHGIKPILQKSVVPANLLDYMDNIHLREWDKNIQFWSDCRYEGTEPDVVIELADMVILIEVKLDSWVSEYQLEREANLLLKQYPHCRKKTLILLAHEASAADIYLEHKEAIPKDVDFGYITWQKVLVALNSVDIADSFQYIIVCDLIKLLIRKGFESFTRFEDYIFYISPDVYWVFDIPGFCFKSHKIVKGNLYYEFK